MAGHSVQGLVVAESEPFYSFRTVQILLLICIKRERWCIPRRACKSDPIGGFVVYTQSQRITATSAS